MSSAKELPGLYNILYGSGDLQNSKIRREGGLNEHNSEKMMTGGRKRMQTWAHCSSQS